MKKLLMILAVSVNVQAAHAYNYHCTISPNSNGNVLNGDPLDVVVNSKSIKITTLAESENEVYSGEVDSTYSPRANNINFVRFQYLDGASEGYINALAEKKLINGEAKGALKVQWGGEGFDQDFYFCSKLK